MRMRGIRGLIVVGSFAAAFAASAPGAVAAGIPDASCTVNPGSSIVQPNGDLKVAVLFGALHDGVLDTATTTVTTPASPTPGDWKFEIAETVNFASYLVVASATVPNTLGPNTQGAITGTFAHPAHVSAGGSYALLISRPGSNGYHVADQGGDPCPTSQAYYQNAVGGPFINYNAVDLGFATTVQPLTASATKKCKHRKHKKHDAAAKKHKKCKRKTKRK